MDDELINTRGGINKGVLRCADCILIGDKVHLREKNISHIFLSTYIKYPIKTFENFENLLKTNSNLSNNMRVIIGGSDFVFPGDFFGKNNTRFSSAAEDFVSFQNILKRLYYLRSLFLDKRIEKVFVENLGSFFAPHCYPFPLGANPRECSVSLNYFLNNKISGHRLFKFTELNRQRPGPLWTERREVRKFSTNAWREFYHELPETKTHSEFCKYIQTCMFTVCVHGHGLDYCPKIYEAIIFGIIPIIRRIRPSTDIWEDDFPVIIVDEWSEKTITYSKLCSWYDKCEKYLKNDDIRQNLLDKLTLNNWWNNIFLK